jgi:hypothetical protein
MGSSLRSCAIFPVSLATSWVTSLFAAAPFADFNENGAENGEEDEFKECHGVCSFGCWSHQAAPLRRDALQRVSTFFFREQSFLDLTTRGAYFGDRKSLAIKFLVVRLVDGRLMIAPAPQSPIDRILLLRL